MTDSGSAHPAGWYPDPEQAQTQRFWDGMAWTEQRVPMQPGAQAASSVPTGAWVAGGGVLALVIATFLPYMESREFSAVVDNSLVQHTEGQILLLLALVAALGIYRNVRGEGWGSAVAVLGLIVITIAIFIGANPPELHSAISTEGLSLSQSLEVQSLSEVANPAIGVYLAGLGGVLITAGGLSLWQRRKERGSAPLHFVK